MTSIGSYAQNQFVLRNNTDAQARVQDYRIQVSTGFKAQRYDGIAADSRRLEGLEQQHAQNKAFTENIERTELRLNTMESSIEGLQGIAKDFRTTLLSAANAENLKNLDLNKIASDLRQEAVSLINTETEGRYLFSGSATSTPPVSDQSTGDIITDHPDISSDQLYYQGNAQTLSVRADTGVKLDYGISADPNEETGIKELLTALTHVMQPSLSQENVTNALNALTGEAHAPNGGAIAKLADTRAQIGSSLDLMEGIRTRLEDNQVDVEAGISDIEDVDVSRAMTLLAEQQTTLETSYAVTARLARTSLLNFL